MKILFLTDNFPPESNAPATRTYEHCMTWVKNGIQVTVITGVPNFPKGKVYNGYKNKLYQTEYVDGIRVIRVWTYISANSGFLKRILDYLSFMITSFWAGLFIKTDVIVATSPQFFTAVSGRWLSFWKRKKWVMEVRDLWPESIKAVGAMKDGLAIQVFERLEMSMYRTAWKIILVTDTFKEQLTQRGIEKEKMEVVKNGANLALFSPIPKNRELLIKHELDGKFIIGYIGTHGMAHKLDFILDCAANEENEDIHFLFIGSGAEKQNLIDLKNRLQLKNVTMLDAIDKGMVKEYTSILDVGLVNLKKSNTFKAVIPSKIFELSAMNKPILLGVEGESKKMVVDYNIGIPFEPENKESFLEKISEIRDQSNRNWGFKSFLKDFDRKDLATKMINFIGAE